jgi:dipeptidyl aminopeptidase/acylaminoacyl peptidase
MKTFLFAALAALPTTLTPSPAEADLAAVAGNSHLQAFGVPAIPAAQMNSAVQYESIRSASLQDVSQDGREILITTRFASTTQLHRVSHPLGDRHQLTFGDEPIGQARFVPGNPKVMFYLQDTGGAEFFQLYRLEVETGRSVLLTDGKSRHQSLIVSADGKRLAFGGTDRNGKDTDVYLGSVAGAEPPKRITELEGTWVPVDFSPNAKELLVIKERSITDADLHWFNLETGMQRQLTPKEGKGSVAAAKFTADGRGIYLVTDRYSDHNQLYRMDLAHPGAKPQALVSNIPHDLEHLAVSRDGALVAFAANEDGYSRLYLLDLKAKRTRSVDLPKGVISQLIFAPRRSTQLMVDMESPRAPADVWELNTKTMKLARWTHSEIGGLNEKDFIDPRIVRYPSKDDVLVPALVYSPAEKSAGKLPVVVLWHGGPEGQSRPTFSALAQLLVANLGTFVVLPNVRGSSGYGKRYLSMDDGVKREASLADIGATLDWIGRQPDMDSSRIGVYGGSYGGYMVLASVAFFPSRIRAGVDVVGVSSLPSLLQHTQPYRRDLRRAEYGDERIPEVRAVQERISPLNRSGDIKAPLFVIHGKNDPRVPLSEAEQIVSTLKAQGKDVWFLLADNEGHGFKKRENRDFMNAAALLFLRQKLVESPHKVGS